MLVSVCLSLLCVCLIFMSVSVSPYLQHCQVYILHLIAHYFIFKSINIFILLYSLCPSHRILSVHALTSYLYQSGMGHTREELSIRECQMIADQFGYRLHHRSPPSGVFVCVWSIDFCHSISPLPRFLVYVYFWIDFYFLSSQISPWLRQPPHKISGWTFSVKIILLLLCSWFNWKI